VLATITLGLVVGAAIGYGTYSITRDELDRGQIADAARLQAQANAYLKYQAALARGRAADAARLQAQANANAYLSGERGLTRGQLADAARLQAQGDAFISRKGDLTGFASSPARAESDSPLRVRRRMPPQ
jgi:hypothetical protein